MKEIEAITNWESFMKSLQIQFMTSAYDDPMKALINLK
jgi:hypothetical protein